MATARTLRLPHPPLHSHSEKETISSPTAAYPYHNQNTNNSPRHYANQKNYKHVPILTSANNQTYNINNSTSNSVNSNKNHNNSNILPNPPALPHPIPSVNANPSKLVKSHPPSLRVALWDTVHQRKVSGFASPLEKNLKRYMEAHPNYILYETYLKRKAKEEARQAKGLLGYNNSKIEMIDSEDEEDEKEDEEKKKTAHKEEMKDSTNSINSPPSNNLISKISQKSISITSIQIPKYAQTSRFDRKFDDEKGTKQGDENIDNDDNSAKSQSSNSTGNHSIESDSEGESDSDKSHISSSSTPSSPVNSPLVSSIEDKKYLTSLRHEFHDSSNNSTDDEDANSDSERIIDDSNNDDGMRSDYESSLTFSDQNNSSSFLHLPSLSQFHSNRNNTSTIVNNNPNNLIHPLRVNDNMSLLSYPPSKSGRPCFDLESLTSIPYKPSPEPLHFESFLSRNQQQCDEEQLLSPNQTNRIQFFNAEPISPPTPLSGMSDESNSNSNSSNIMINSKISDHQRTNRESLLVVDDGVKTSSSSLSLGGEFLSSSSSSSSSSSPSTSSTSTTLTPFISSLSYSYPSSISSFTSGFSLSPLDTYTADNNDNEIFIPILSPLRSQMSTNQGDKNIRRGEHFLVVEKSNKSRKNDENSMDMDS